MKQKVKKDVSSNQTGSLIIVEQRYFSESFKREKVEELVAKRLTIQELCELYNVSRTSVYKWLYRYSPHHSQKSKMVVEMESEASKTKNLQARIAELERVIGQKQLEIDFNNKVFELAGASLGFDVKKNFSMEPSNGTVKTVPVGQKKDKT